MKADLTRTTFNPEKHYTAVLLQQGRVQLDADWNEQLAIQEHLDTTTRQDIIGGCGGPIDDCGFALAPAAVDIEIGAGRYYGDGILCENGEPVLFTEQPDLPGVVLPVDAG